MSMWKAADAVCQLLLRAKGPAVVWMLRHEWHSCIGCSRAEAQRWHRWLKLRTRLVELDHELII